MRCAKDQIIGTHSDIPRNRHTVKWSDSSFNIFSFLELNLSLTDLHHNLSFEV